MSKSSGTFFAFLSGAIAGALIGILYAPDKGSNTRDRLTYNLSKYIEKLEELLNELLDETEKLETTAQESGRKVVEETKDRAEKLLSDVDDLILKIKGDDKPS